MPGHEQLVSEHPLAFLEHYHIGLASILADKAFKLNGLGIGFGAVLIADEFRHDKPFGIGEPEEKLKKNLATTILLGTFLALAYG